MTNRKALVAGRAKRRVHAPGLLARFGYVPAPTKEVALGRIRARPGLFASMSDEARAMWDSYEGPENMGPPSDDE